MTHTLCIIQARMGSTRFPGKVLKPLGDRDMTILGWVVRAAKQAQGVSRVVVATSGLKADDAIVSWCTKNRTNVFCGSETDVLDRFYQCATEYGADIVIRLTADCPFLDSNVISDVIRLRKMTNASYCSNIDPPTYPDGLDVECFTYPALKSAWSEATRVSDRDCVPQYICRNRDRFPAANLTCPLPGLRKERWVLDTEDDYAFCQAVEQRLLGPPSLQSILAVLDKYPEMRKLNSMWERNERFYEAVSTENLGKREYKRSDHHLQRALRTIPFGAQTFSKSHIQFPASQAPLYVTHADGCRIYDVDGNDYIDMVNAILPVILGYRDPDVDQAIRRQLDSGISFSLGTKIEAELSEMLCHYIPCAEMVKFGKSGTDVTTAAVRLARAYTGRDLVLIGGYHGWSDWSMACTDRNKGIPWSVKALSNRLADDSPLLKQYPDKIAAIIVEPNDNPNYLNDLRFHCNRYGIVLIFDEIITGFRYDMGGAQKLFGVTPDLACFGKAMANGMPLSAIVGKREIMKLMQPPDNIFYSGTMFGETLSIAAAIATIKKLDKEKVLPHIHATGIALADRVDTLLAYYGLDQLISLNGHASRMILKFEGPDKDKIRTFLMMEMAKEGVLIINSHNISYAHRPVDLQRVRIAYDRTFSKLKEAIDAGNLDQKVGNHIVSAAPLRATA